MKVPMIPQAMDTKTPANRALSMKVLDEKGVMNMFISTEGFQRLSGLDCA
jgi:hypothetical protein